MKKVLFIDWNNEHNKIKIKIEANKRKSIIFNYKILLHNAPLICCSEFCDLYFSGSYISSPLIKYPNFCEFCNKIFTEYPEFREWCISNGVHLNNISPVCCYEKYKKWRS